MVKKQCDNELELVRLHCPFRRSQATNAWSPWDVREHGYGEATILWLMFRPLVGICEMR
jgi:hypothetical protein